MLFDSGAGRGAGPDSGYQAILFDWDGTAVADRESDAARLALCLEGVLRAGVFCAAITGTSRAHLDRTLGERLTPLARRNLIYCCNRGSEVFGFDRSGESEVLFRRQATQEQNALLDRASSALQSALSLRGLETRVISDRLNRRKIDLIPVQRWREPRKAELAELLKAVRERLVTAGIPEGLPWILELATEVARKYGLPEARITSDIKHVEIGLTDKADSVRWIVQHALRERGIEGSRSAWVGDEFGSVGGLPGSDSLMRSLPELEKAEFLSVGVEPEGAPSWVKHLGGGAERFLEFLESQRALLAARDPLGSQLWGWGWLDADTTWLLEQEGFDPSRERELEAIFSFGNGAVGVRGGTSFPLPASRSDLFVAGVYDRKLQQLPYSESEFLTSGARVSDQAEIASFPSPFRLRLRSKDQDFVPGRTPGLEFKRVLNLRNGILVEEFKESQCLIRTARVCCLQDRAIFLHEVELIVEATELTSLLLDTSMEEPDQKTRHPHLRLLSDRRGVEGASEIHEYETLHSKTACVFATRTELDGREILEPRIDLQARLGHNRWVVRRLIAWDTTAAKALERLRGFSWEDFPVALARNAADWRWFWAKADLRFSGKPQITEAQRFNGFQMRIAAGTDPRISIGARSLTGRAYEGHVFWDAEVFVFPFLLHTDPALARNVLDYRYRTLAGARARAAAMGHRGACYAWESTLDGSDTTPRKILLKGTGQEIPIFTGEQQIHVTADVCHAIWRYVQATGDQAWLREFGVEILVEAARFWTSRLVREADGRSHILRVVGPDEYHHDVDDNAFTNWMAKWNLRYCAEVCGGMAQEAPAQWGLLVERLGIGPQEVEEWRGISESVFLPEPDAQGVFEQFRGYFDLRNSHVPREQILRAPLDRLLNWEWVNSTQIIKQADVLMIPFLFPEAWSQEVTHANYRFYEARTDHGSSLSPAVHAGVAALAGSLQDARRYWDLSLHLDLLNTMRNTALGLHVGCMGASWQSLLFHVLGVRVEDSGPRIARKARPEGEEPLPPEWAEVSARLLFRGRLFHLGTHPEKGTLIWQDPNERLKEAA